MIKKKITYDEIWQLSEKVAEKLKSVAGKVVKQKGKKNKTA